MGLMLPCAVKSCVALVMQTEATLCPIHQTRGKDFRTEVGPPGDAVAPGDCIWCEGTGECPDCDGTGEHECDCGDEHDCHKCAGSGDCDACDGSGYKSRDEKRSKGSDRDSEVEYLKWAFWTYQPPPPLVAWPWDKGLWD
jgi:hypothetical protein